MEDNKALKIVYTFFLGLLLAIFVGVGINTFYTPPQAPAYPTDTTAYGKELTAEQIEAQKKHDRDYAAYNQKEKPYNRNVSIIALIAAVLLLVISLTFEKRIRVIADGILLGGVFVLLYSIMRSFAADDTKYTFIVLTIGLIVALYLGYHRFIRDPSPKK